MSKFRWPDKYNQPFASIDPKNYNYCPICKKKLQLKDISDIEYCSVCDVGFTIKNGRLIKDNYDIIKPKKKYKKQDHIEGQMNLFEVTMK